MKECYKCDKCGEDFDSKKECLAHEYKCDGAISKRLHAIEKRLDEIEKTLSRKADISQLPYKVNLCDNNRNSGGFTWSDTKIELVNQVRDSMNRKKSAEKKTE